jgi:hypothetical protein
MQASRSINILKNPFTDLPLRIPELPDVARCDWLWSDSWWYVKSAPTVTSQNSLYLVPHMVTCMSPNKGNLMHRCGHRWRCRAASWRSVEAGMIGLVWVRRHHPVFCHLSQPYVRSADAKVQRPGTVCWNLFAWRGVITRSEWLPSITAFHACHIVIDHPQEMKERIPSVPNTQTRHIIWFAEEAFSTLVTRPGTSQRRRERACLFRWQ